MSVKLSKDVLNLDYKAEIEKIAAALREALRSKLHRRGLVIAMSSGIDSSVSAALAVKALGPNKVYGLMLPEQDSASESQCKAETLAKHLGIKYEVHNIAPTLEALGCYRLRDQAIKETFPEYGADWKNKIVIAGGIEGQLNHFNLVVQKPDGTVQEKRLDLRQYLQIVAATNYKQRIRKTVEYFHADRLNYAVIGTPNRLEYDQGFFVKNGDGSADVKPIAHLYKSQIYALARFMELPPEICNTIPTTDTYSMPQGQDEFYFALPYQQMDLALWALNHQVPAAELGKVLGIDEKRAQFVYNDIIAKRKATAYMHAHPVLVEPVNEISH